MSHSSERVFIIGLDGAPPGHVRRWTAAGELPVLAQILERGCVGRLQSSIPWDTPSAWASLMTGMNPGNHGVYDFWSVGAGGEITINTRRSVRAEPFWRYLSERNRTVGVFGVPLTYPAEPVNGFLVAGTPCVPDKKWFTFPDFLYEHLRKKGWDLGMTVFSGVPSSPQDMFEFLIGLVRMRVEACTYLMGEFPWEFLFLHFLETDVAGHRFLHYMSEYEKAPSAHRELLLNFYKRVDAELEPLVSMLDENTTLIVMSDHGMGPRSRVISLNGWLVQKGYMQLRDSFGTNLKAARLGVPHLLSAMHSRPVVPILKIMQRASVKSLIYHMMRAGARSLGGGKPWTLPGWITNPALGLSLSAEHVDWNCTKAFSLGSGPVGTIYLNLRGRQPQGVVDPGHESDLLCRQLAEDLLTLTDPTSGGLIVARVARGEELYWGPYASEAPDLVVFFRDQEYEALRFGQFLPGTQVIASPRLRDFASHRPMGLFAIKGPNTRKSMEVSDISIMDIAPTVLFLLGEPIPDDMDGTVLEQCFEESYIRHTRPQEQTVAQTTPSKTQPSGLEPHDQEENRAMSNLLRALGYLD